MKIEVWWQRLICIVNVDEIFHELAGSLWLRNASPNI